MRAQPLRPPRATLNIAKLDAAGAEMFCRHPAVCRLRGFLSAEECAHFKEVGRVGMKRADVMGDDKTIKMKGRTNSHAWFRHDHDPVFKAVADRIAALVGIPLSHAEEFQLIWYRSREQYKAHLDGFDVETKAGRDSWRYGGQRVATALAYLNTVEQGGGTGFPKLKLTVPAEAGTLCVFQNTLPHSSLRHPDSLHAGLPVVSGEKWAFNLWFREADRRTQPPFPPQVRKFQGGRQSSLGNAILSQRHQR
ncbi:MAG: 2OG-Fe(II) oxygenase [Rhodothalassiaceae bacterium]